jgi:hypothetical protein
MMNSSIDLINTGDPDRKNYAVFAVGSISGWFYFWLFLKLSSMIKTIFISSAFLAKSMAQLTQQQVLAQQQQQGICLNERSNCLTPLNTSCPDFTPNMQNSSVQTEDMLKQLDCNCESAKSFATW